MIKLNKIQTQWLQQTYNKAFTASGDSAFSLRFATKVYNESKLNPNFELPDGSRAGLVALPVETEGVDVKNPEEALSYAVDKELDSYIASSGNLDEILPLDESLAMVEDTIDNELFGGEDTFTDFENRDSRFKRSLASNDTDSLKGIVGELVTDRVTQRNKVLSK